MSHSGLLVIIEQLVKYSTMSNALNPVTDLIVNSTVVHRPVTVYDSEKQFIENTVLGPHFPWFWQDQQTFDDETVIKNNLPKELHSLTNFYNGPFLSHVLLHRQEEEDNPTKSISTHFEFFIEIFHRFMKENNLPYSKIYRANLNLTWHNGDYHTAPHLDHDWPHSNFIMYLSTCEKGHTIVWPDDFSTTYMLPCIQYTAATFKAHWHAHRYPEPRSKRLAFVVTYI